MNKLQYLPMQEKALSPRIKKLKDRVLDTHRLI